MAAQLPLGKVLFGAFLVPWWNRRVFARALAIPLTSMVVLNLAWYYAHDYLPGFSNWVVYFLYCALFALFAVTCHRLVLLDPHSVAVRIGLRWSRRETKFLAWMIVVVLLFWVATGVLATPIMNVLFWSGLETANASAWSLYAGQLLALYIVSRLFPIFPATAIDRRVNPKWAWRLSKSNGWRLVVIVAVLPWALSKLVSLLYRENESVLEDILIAFLGFAIFAFEIAALSLTYRELTREEAPS